MLTRLQAINQCVCTYRMGQGTVLGLPQINEEGDMGNGWKSYLQRHLMAINLNTFMKRKFKQ